MRRLLVTLLVAMGFVLVSEVPASACSCAVATLTQQAHRADAVFTGEVTQVVPGDPAASAQTRYDISVETVYKGTVSAQTTVVSASQTAACGLSGVVASRRYLFLGTSNGTGVRIAANSCGGTRPLTAGATARIVEVLGEGKAPTPVAPTTPPEPVLTRADLAEPTPLSRLAAPGGALVIVGLLGLLLLRRKA